MWLFKCRFQRHKWNDLFTSTVQETKETALWFSSWFYCLITNVNYFSFYSFLASRLWPKFSLFPLFQRFWNHVLTWEIWGIRSDQYKEWFKSICMTSLLHRHIFEFVMRLASHADVLRADHALFISLRKKSRKSFPFKDWVKEQRACNCVRSANKKKQWNNQPGV